MRFETEPSSVVSDIESIIIVLIKYLTVIVLCIVASDIAQADRNVRFTGSFESGIILPNGGDTDSFFIKTLPDPQIGGKAIKTGSGGGGPAALWDLKVVPGDVIGGELVTPRSGKFFAKYELYYDKDYRGLNGGVLEKARAALAATHDAARIDFDTEVYAGISIFVPENYEHETGTKGDRGSEILVVLATDSSATFMTLRVFVPKDDDEAHWYIDYSINPYSVEENRRYYKRVDLGHVNPDKGKWTDFVLRFRVNPFSVKTNPAEQGIDNANDQVYEGNKGILQLWKAVGPVDEDGNRAMIRKVNLVNTPVGNVPGTTQGESKLAFGLRIYKYKWQTMPTDVKGPVIFGFDEFRFGEVIRNGTGYADVHPTQQLCTDGCPAGSMRQPLEEADPKPPELKVAN